MRRTRYQIALGMRSEIPEPTTPLRRPAPRDLPPRPSLTVGHRRFDLIERAQELARRAWPATAWPVFSKPNGGSLRFTAGDVIRFTWGSHWYRIKLLDIRDDTPRTTVFMRLEASDDNNREKRTTNTTAQEFMARMRPFLEHTIVKVRRGFKTVFEKYPY